MAELSLNLAHAARVPALMARLRMRGRRAPHGIAGEAPAAEGALPRPLLYGARADTCRFARPSARRRAQPISISFIYREKPEASAHRAKGQRLGLG